MPRQSGLPDPNQAANSGEAIPIGDPRILYDEQGREYGIGPNGQRVYAYKPGSHYGGSGGLIHKPDVFNKQTGQWEKGGIDWGKVGIFAGLAATGGYAGYAALGGAGGAGLVSPAIGPGSGELAVGGGGTLASTQIGTGFIPAITGGSGLAGPGVAAATLPSTAIGTVGVLGQGAPALTGPTTPATMAATNTALNAGTPAGLAAPGMTDTERLLASLSQANPKWYESPNLYGQIANGIFQLWGANAATNANLDVAKIQSEAAKYAADLLAKGQAENLAWLKQQAEADWRNAEANRHANYDIYAAGERRMGQLGDLIGVHNREIPGYVPTEDPRFIDPSAVPPPAATPAPVVPTNPMATNPYVSTLNTLVAPVTDTAPAIPATPYQPTPLAARTPYTPYTPYATTMRSLYGRT